MVINLSKSLFVTNVNATTIVSQRFENDYCERGKRLFEMYCFKTVKPLLSFDVLVNKRVLS